MEEVKRLVKAYIKENQGADYIEIAEACGIDLDLTVRACRELVEDGAVKSWEAPA